MGVEVPSNPINRKEQYLAKIAGQAVEIPAEPLTREEAYLDEIAKNGGGGGGGTTNYNLLSNKPQIEGTELQGNKSLADLGIASVQSVENITNGEEINDFAGVESALSGKQDALTAGDYIDISAQNEIKVNRSIAKTQVHKYNMFFNSGRYCTITKYIDDEQVGSATTYDYLNMSPNPAEIDDVMTLKANGDTGNWLVTNLVASHDHTAGYVETRYRGSNDNTYVQEFDVVVDADKKLIIQSELDDAMATKQDALTFDDTPTYGSNNPVKSNGIYDALALKQNATDNSLETEAKTIVGAINEHEGDIGLLKSGLTNLNNEVNGDATTYPYADVITIEDAVPSNLADCKVKVEPQQDLHGYDHTWVGGAGKNKLPLVLADIKAANTDGSWSGNTYTLNSATFTINEDNAGNIISIVGVGNGNNGNTIILPFTLVAGSYILSSNFTEANGLNDTYLHDGNAVIARGNNATPGPSFTLGSDTNVTWYFRVTANNTFVCSPMLRLSTETDATFAPYTNICPITGHTEASVQRVGKNVLPSTLAIIKAANTNGTWTNNVYSYNGVDFTVNTNIDGYVKSITAANAATTETSSALYIPMPKDNNKYLFNGGVDTDHNIIVWDATTNARAKKWDGTTNSDASTGSTLLEVSNVSDHNLTVRCRVSSGVAAGSKTFYPMVCASNTTDPTFVPYAGQTYTIALGDTIYGGTVDFDSGVMTVDRVIVDLGTQTWHYSNTSTQFYTDEIANAKTGTVIDALLCSCYEIDNRSYSQYSEPHLRYLKDLRIYVIDTNYTDPTVFASAVNGQTVVYPLSAHTTIQLTPTQIQLLKGTNTLTASTGQISVTVNGVSGAIGSVQEQVNEIAEDVETITSMKSATAGTNVTIDGGGYITVGNMVIVNIEFTADDNIASNTVLLNLPNELLTNTPINIYDKSTYNMLSKGRIYNGKLMASEQIASSSSYYVAGVYIKS